MDIGALGFWLLLAIIAVGVMWTHTRKLQLRKELVESMLQKGQSVDVEQIDRLLGAPHLGRDRRHFGHRDPRSPYRTASFAMFVVGFATLFVAFTREPPMYLLALLGALPLFLAASIWITCNREYAAGTLATLQHSRDPREGWQAGGGWVFWIGYATIFMAISRHDANLPLIVIGGIAIAAAFWIWHSGNRQYAEGKIPVHGPDSDDRPE